MTACVGLCPSVPSAGSVMPSSALVCEPAALREQVAMLVEKRMCCWRIRSDGCRKKSRTCAGRCAGTAATAANPLRRTVRGDGDAACTVGRAGGRGQPGHRGLTRHQVAPCQVDTQWSYPLRATCSFRQYRYWRIRHRHCLHACGRTCMVHRCSMHDKPPTHGCLRFGNRMRFHPRTGTRPLY